MEDVKKEEILSHLDYTISLVKKFYNSVPMSQVDEIIDELIKVEGEVKEYQMIRKRELLERLKDVELQIEWLIDKYDELEKKVKKAKK